MCSHTYQLTITFMFPTHIQHHHDNIRPSLITLDSPYNSYGVTHMARPWESALHVDPTCLDDDISSTGTSIGPFNDRLPRSERLTRSSPSVSDFSATRTFSFCRLTNFGILFRVLKNVVCMYVILC